MTDLKRVIAYSTISQIGYMVLGVSVAAYGAGLFHLMTHAFFKALLFMGAGSVIGAMAGEQSIDRMGGFRKAMPFTFVTFTIGALALAGFPPLSGFFSKDEILAFTLNRGGGYVVLGGARLHRRRSSPPSTRSGWSSACSSASRCPRRASSSAATSPTASPQNPPTGEAEDTDVGFPGPEHHIAERCVADEGRDGPLALLAVVGGVVGIPGVTDTLEHFLEPTFEDSRFHDDAPERRRRVARPRRSAALLGLLGIARRLRASTCAGARCASRSASASTPLHTFLVNKWYFDELYDAVVRPPAGGVRPLRAPRDRDASSCRA